MLLLFDAPLLGLSLFRHHRLRFGLDDLGLLVLALEFCQPSEERLSLSLLVPLLGTKGGQLPTSVHQACAKLLALLQQPVLLGRGLSLLEFLLSSLELSPRLPQRLLQAARVLPCLIQHAP